MVDKKLNIEKIDINSLVPADYNPRKISEKDYANLKKSIDEFGIVDPIIVNLNDNTIIGGHQRFDVLFYENNLQELYLIKLGDIGWVFPDTDLKIKDKNHEKTLNLALNRVHGEWDEDLLNNVLIELEELNLDHLTGFDLELDDINYSFISRIEDDEEEIYDDEELIEEDFEEDISEEIFQENINNEDEEEIIEVIETTNTSEKTPNVKKEENRIKRGFVKYGDVYAIADSSFLMFGNPNNEQDRTKLFKFTPILFNDQSIELPKKVKKVKTITREVNYYISDDAELIEKYIIENNNICKKVSS